VAPKKGTEGAQDQDAVPAFNREDLTMTDAELVTLALEMRDAQRKFYACAKAAERKLLLVEAKTLEARFDRAALDRRPGDRGRTGSLFGDDAGGGRGAYS
jgi:hypothetical protein